MRLSHLTGLLALLCLTPAAQAADAVAEPPLTVNALPLTATDRPVQADLKPRPLWELGVGVGGLVLPDYRGSDQSQAYLLPTPYLVYRGQWLKADRDGARALLVNTDSLKLDVSVGASPPARTKDNKARAGMPNLAGTFEIGPDLNVRLAAAPQDRWRLELRLPLRAAVTLQSSPRFIGATFSPNLNLDIKDLPHGWQLGLLTGPLFADAKNNGFFYNVDAPYATPSRPAYRAGGGYAGWRALAATSRRVGNAWMGAFLRYDHLGSAVFEDSPLVRKKSAVSAGFAINWVFATSSQTVQAED